MNGGGRGRTGTGEALQSTQGVYRLLAEEFVDPLFFASDGLVRWIAPSIEATLGWTPEEIEARPLADLAHGEDRYGLAMLMKAVTAGRPGRGVFRLRSKDGGYLWVLVTLSAEATGDADTRVVGSLREIDRRVRAEQKLRLVTEHTSSVLVTAGLDRRVTWVSPNVTRVLGWTPAELHDTVVADVIHPDDRANADVTFDPVRGDDRCVAAVHGILLRLRDRQGVYHWMSAACTVTTDADGRINGMIGTFTDANELVKSREAVQREAERIHAVLDSLPDSHGVFSPVRDASGSIADFRFEEVNAAGAGYWGQPPEGLIGCRVSERLPGFESSPLLTLGAHVIETGEPLAVDEYCYANFPLTGHDACLSIRAVNVNGLLSVMWRDVTAKCAETRAMEQSEARYRLLADNVMDVVVHRQAHQVIWVSPSLKDMLGWSPEDWIGRQYSDFVHPSDLAEFNQKTLSIREVGHVVDRYRMRAKDLKYHWVESHSKPYIDDHGTVDGIVSTFRTIDSEVAAQQQFAHAAQHDALTGLINRDEALARVGAITGRQRNPGQETAILFCDVDKFKEVNDHYGHAAGDEVLRVIATRVAGQVRVGDTAARIGGDELMVILNRVHDLSDAVRVAEKMLHAASEPVVVPDGVVATSLSIGATLVRPGEDADTLIARADAAMYEAKANGRNRVIAFNGQVE